MFDRGAKSVLLTGSDFGTFIETHSLVEALSTAHCPLFNLANSPVNVDTLLLAICHLLQVLSKRAPIDRLFDPPNGEAKTSAPGVALVLVCGPLALLNLEGRISKARKPWKGRQAWVHSALARTDPHSARVVLMPVRWPAARARLPSGR